MIFIIAAIFSYINVPVADMREGPSDHSKMDSQAIYSEKVDIIAEQGQWAKIKTPDAYTAWTYKTSILQTDKEKFPPQTKFAVVNRCSAHIYDVKDIEFGPILTLPFESKLEVVDDFDDPSGRWLQVRLIDGTLAYIQSGDVILNPRLMNLNEVIEFSYQFLDLPYTWGGRSSFGYDCSGFVQMLYRLMGITLPRNSRDQAAWQGFKEISLDSLQAGDLIFFGRDKDKISHVGLYISEGRFIHTSAQENKPYMRISSLQDPTWNGTQAPYPYRTARRMKDESAQRNNSPQRHKEHKEYRAQRKVTGYPR